MAGVDEDAAVADKEKKKIRCKVNQSNSNLPAVMAKTDGKGRYRPEKTSTFQGAYNSLPWLQVQE